MTYDGTGRLTANEIAATYGQRILAGASQLMERTDGRAVEVFPSFMTKGLYGRYNWQTATYEVESR